LEHGSPGAGRCRDSGGARPGELVKKLKSTRHLLACVCTAAFVAAAAAGVLAQAAKEPGTVVLTGSPMGGVKLDHKAHAKDRGIKCETCHHASKPEKPMKAAQQKCQDCHTKVATPPMKTKTQAAFHDPMAKKGICVDCHQQSIAAGKKSPSKCADCHKKENT
jgi:Class III cytochrome C family